MKIYNDVTITIIYAFLDLNFGVYMNQNSWSKNKLILKHSFLRNHF